MSTASWLDNAELGGFAALDVITHAGAAALTTVSGGYLEVEGTEYAAAEYSEQVAKGIGSKSHTIDAMQKLGDTETAKAAALLAGKTSEQQGDLAKGARMTVTHIGDQVASGTNWLPVVGAGLAVLGVGVFAWKLAD